MGTLLVDNSNTRTKFALVENDALLEWRETILTEELREDAILKLASHHSLQSAVICSVVPTKAELLQETLKQKAPTHLISHQSKLSIAIDYPKPEQIGADRLANAVAVHARFGCPAIVVDFGTAVTFDVVGSPAAYLGGTIAPGLASMTESLARRTALLPKIELEEPSTAIGKSTEEAMKIGAVIGYRGLVREILRSTQEQLGEKAIVVATGGDAALIARGLPEVAHVVPDLTLEGIQRIGSLNT